jgi:hypothetical protein
MRPNRFAVHIWISNIASKATPAFRVIVFAEGEFTAQDGTALEVSKDADMWRRSWQKMAVNSASWTL